MTVSLSTLKSLQVAALTIEALNLGINVRGADYNVNPLIPARFHVKYAPEVPLLTLTEEQLRKEMDICRKRSL